ncbi:MAG: glycoside hydrolase family 78 protein [Tannerella sp.]|jgi:alpha-L-rhamnosidase|nr:glycoside hydrolase family 78 protein [Tannerella sp.]
MKHMFSILLAITILSSCSRETPEVSHLQCEYLCDPVAIESKAPLLSWQLHSASRGKSQTAYRILAAGHPNLLSEGKADYWDSGKVASSQSVQVGYGGKPLASRQQVYWKVMIWDENGRPSSWSQTAVWSMGLLHPTDWTARWIGLLADPSPDSVHTHPAPYFRKEFSAGKTIRQAKAYVCGLGFYELYLNGEKVGDRVLSPAVTNYDERRLPNLIYFYDDQSTQRVLYNTFDVTELLQKGTNTVGALLGNGWYNQRDRTVEGCLWYDTPKFILQLEIAYTDGSTEKVQTDESWKCTTGPLLHDAIFTGEVYDARLELGDWHTNGYNDSAWQPALAVNAPSGRLQPQLAPPDRVTRSMVPGFNGRINDSTFLYTLPEMISGWAGLTVQGKAGDEIELRFYGEEGEDFGQSDTYILKGGAPEHWEPRFTWHAFRSIRVITQEVAMNPESVVVKVVNTDPAETGSFECSNELFNRINASYLLTQKGNFHGSISSDCPHRERLAYTGDGQVSVESALWSFDMTQFYRKWFDDMDDARNKRTGYVPHTAPFAGGGGGPAWGSAYVIMPWAYYCQYGDKTLLEQHYQGMKQWVEYLATRTDDRGIVVREEPNGWCLGDWCTPDRIELPEPLVNTAYYYHVTDLMSRVSDVLGHKADCAYFLESAHRIKSDFNRVFFNPSTHRYWENRQGANVFPLAFGLTPEEEKDVVFHVLLEQLETIQYHFDTGILATPLLLKVLTEHGRADIAYRLMNQRTAPGFGYLLDDAYSCLWESWGGKASRNHPMFGSVVAWFYRSLAGIRPDESQPGMKHFLIAPQPVDALTHCAASHESLYGTIRSEWKQSPCHFDLTVEIPANTTATVFLPNRDSRPVRESGVPLTEAKGVNYVGESDACSVVEIASGTYHFDY